MTQTHTPKNYLHHTHECGNNGECQNSHTTAKNTEQHSPTLQPLQQENAKGKQNCSVLSAERQKLSEIGSGSNFKLLTGTEASAVVAERVNQGSSLSTTPTETAESTARQDCEAGGSTSGLSRRDAQKTDSGSFATTATALEGSLGNAHTKASFTPGPWLTGKTPIHKADEVYSKEGMRIAQCSAREKSTPLTEANTRLIAAAPELLEALQFIAYDAVMTIEEAREISRTAIAKARGEA